MWVGVPPLTHRYHGCTCQARAPATVGKALRRKPPDRTGEDGLARCWALREVRSPPGPGVHPESLSLPCLLPLAWTERHGFSPRAPTWAPRLGPPLPSEPERLRPAAPLCPNPNLLSGQFQQLGPGLTSRSAGRPLAHTGVPRQADSVVGCRQQGKRFSQGRAFPGRDAGRVGQGGQGLGTARGREHRPGKLLGTHPGSLSPPLSLPHPSLLLPEHCHWLLSSPGAPKTTAPEA